MKKKIAKLTGRRSKRKRFTPGELHSLSLSLSEGLMTPPAVLTYDRGADQIWKVQMNAVLRFLAADDGQLIAVRQNTVSVAHQVLQFRYFVFGFAKRMLQHLAVLTTHLREKIQLSTNLS